MAEISRYSPCPKCGYPNGFGCEFCSKAQVKRGPKPKSYTSPPMRVPEPLHGEVKEMVDKWKRENK